MRRENILDGNNVACKADGQLNRSTGETAEIGTIEFESGFDKFIVTGIKNRSHCRFTYVSHLPGASGAAPRSTAVHGG